MTRKSIGNFLAFLNNESDRTLTKTTIISARICEPTNCLLETTLNLKKSEDQLKVKLIN
jgi:hypothetical protein